MIAQLVNATRLVDFINARELHRVAADVGWEALSNEHQPDPIIKEFRFCNVRRNDDRETVWIHENYLNHFHRSPYLWFALVVARLFNNSATLHAIRPYVLPFNVIKMRKVLRNREREGVKNFNAAYIVSTNGRAMNKVDYVINVMLQPLWKKRDKLTRDLNVGQLANAHLRLVEEQGLGSFMAAQVLADWKYAKDGREWDDFNTFAASGPGSRRGLNRVIGEPIKRGWREDEFRRTLGVLRDYVNARLQMLPLTAQDLQNCLCEFDKYERFRLGEGRPKQKYVPWEKRQ